MELPANWPLLSVPRSSAPGPQPTPFPTTLQLLLMAGPLPCTMTTLGSPSPLAPGGLRAVRVDKEGGRGSLPPVAHHWKQAGVQQHHQDAKRGYQPDAHQPVDRPESRTAPAVHSHLATRQSR